MRHLVHYITYPLTMPLGRESHIKIKGSDIKREVILKSMESDKKTTMLSLPPAFLVITMVSGLTFLCFPF